MLKLALIIGTILVLLTGTYATDHFDFITEPLNHRDVSLVVVCLLVTEIAINDWRATRGLRGFERWRAKREARKLEPIYSGPIFIGMVIWLVILLLVPN